MNILIVTPFYKQDKNIASVRWTNITKRLAKNHNIIIVTQPLDNDMDMTFSKTYEDGILVARMNQKTTYEKIAVKYFHGATGDDWQTSTSNDKLNTTQKDSTVRVLKNRIMFNSMKLKAKEYARKIKDNVIPKGTKIDIVISSACPFIEMLFGYELKRLLKCKWISDFRDLPFTVDNCDNTSIMKKLMVDKLKCADAIITIASKGKDFLINNRIVESQDKINVITNGFSMADARSNKSIVDDKLHIVHTGSMYGGNRKSDLLFEAIKKAKSIDTYFDYVIECAGGNNETFVNTAKKYGESSNVINRGFISRDEALDLQATADCLLSLVIDRPGSLVAKLFEYILNKKPVINITCGDSIDSEETLFIRKLNIGIAVEESKHDESVEHLSNFLINQWKRKVSHQQLEYNPDYDCISQYDHDNIAKRIDNLCSQCIK